MSGTMKRWVFLALGAALTAMATGCVSPTSDSDSDADEPEQTVEGQQSLGASSAPPANDGAPQPLGGGTAASGNVLPGQDCSEPEPTPWHDRESGDGDDGDDGDSTHATLATTSVSAPSGGHHGR